MKEVQKVETESYLDSDEKKPSQLNEVQNPIPSMGKNVALKDVRKARQQ